MAGIAITITIAMSMETPMNAEDNEICPVADGVVVLIEHLTDPWGGDQCMSRGSFRRKMGDGTLQQRPQDQQPRGRACRGR
jgi:hypothetical protein